MGRGSSGIGSRSLGNGSPADMNVDWDKWGKVLDGANHVAVYDKDGNVIGYIRDDLRFTMIPEERTVTRAEVMKDISGWQNDDGSYGDEDTKIYIAYEDGTFFDSEYPIKRGDNRDKLKKTGVIGASVSTPDYEMVWGGEYKYKNGQKQLVPWTTHSTDEDGNDTGKSNTYSGYKITGEYRVRTKTTYNEKFPNGRPRTRIETIRQSKVRKVDW